MIVPANVEVDGELRLRLTKHRLDGAELKTRVAVPPGTFEARMKLANAPSSVTGLFMYAPPDLAHEIDIELYNQPEGKIRLTTYANGAMTNTVEKSLAFNPTLDFHKYGIAQTSAGVEFYIDNKLVEAWDRGVPTAAMNLYLNAWYPTWLDGLAATNEQRTVVDLAAYTPL